MPDGFQDSATAVGIFALFALMVFREVTGVLKARRPDTVDLRALSRKVDELHSWHDKEDADGVKIWYYRRSLEDSINRLCDVIEKQSQLFDKLYNRVEQSTRTIEEVKKAVEDCPRPA